MQYEIYADLLFLQYVGLNMILLWCLNKRFSHTATWGRLVFSALLGAMGATVGVLQIVPNFLGKAISLIGNAGMLLLSFPGARRGSIANFVKEILIYSFYVGGGFLALCRICTIFQVPSGVLCVGMLLTGVFLLVIAPEGSAAKCSVGHVVLKHNGRTVETWGLVDTGNTLTEPISGKPVAILEPQLLAQLLGEEEDGFRVIPYHSIGKEHGLLRGYCIDELQIRIDGESKKISRVYLAAAPEGISFSERYQGKKRGSKEDREQIGLLLQPRILQ